MLTGRKRKFKTRRCVIATLLSAIALTLATTVTFARPGNGPVDAITFVNAPAQQSDERTTALAVERFVKGMSARDVNAVWMFASEEEQDAFGTEPAIYEAYADAFPEFANAKEVTFTRFWQEGDTNFVHAYLSDASGKVNVATMGLWLDDAGDWKLVSCDVKPFSDRLAGL